jgi:hypothetical protein
MAITTPKSRPAFLNLHDPQKGNSTTINQRNGIFLVILPATGQLAIIRTGGDQSN